MSKRGFLLRHGVLRSPAVDAETGDDNISKCRRQVGGSGGFNHGHLGRRQWQRRPDWRFEAYGTTRTEKRQEVLACSSFPKKN